MLLTALFGEEQLLGRSFLSRGIRKVKNVAKKHPYMAAIVAPPSLLYTAATKKGRSNLAKPIKKTAGFIQRNPYTSSFLMPGIAAPILIGTAMTKKGRTNLAAPVRFAKRHPYMAAVVAPPSLLYTASTKQGRKNLASPIKATGSAIASPFTSSKSSNVVSDMAPALAKAAANLFNQGTSAGGPSEVQSSEGAVADAQEATSGSKTPLIIGALLALGLGAYLLTKKKGH